MSTSIGIHLGNTSACVAVNKNGKVFVVANSHGDRLTPAMVTLNPDETLVGFSSKQSSHRYMNETIRYANSLLGKRCDERALAELVENFNNLGLSVDDHEGTLMYDVKNAGKSKHYSAKHIVTLILQNIFETAQSLTGTDVNEAVFSAPVGFLPSYRDELIDAASSAGFEVIRVISEPASAALAYGIIETECEPEFILVFRVGGITQDVTLMKIHNGMITIQDHITKHCGGDVLTEDIACHFASLFERENRNKINIKQNAKAMRKLRTQAENCKHVLSTMPSASCHIDSLCEGVDYNGSLSRSRFEILVSEHLQTLVQPIRNILDANNISTEEIGKVIMCGGTSNIPKLQEIISNVLPQSEILSSIPPAEVLAIGAATEAGILVNFEDPEITEEDCNLTAAPVNVYVHALDAPEIFIKQGTLLPFTIAKDFLISPLKKCTVQLKYGALEGQNPLENLSEITLDELGDGQCVNVELKYFANGHLVFTCMDKGSGQTKSLTITSN